MGWIKHLNMVFLRFYITVTRKLCSNQLEALHFIGFNKSVFRKGCDSLVINLLSCNCLSFYQNVDLSNTICFPNSYTLSTLFGIDLPITSRDLEQIENISKENVTVLDSSKNWFMNFLL